MKSETIDGIKSSGEKRNEHDSLRDGDKIDEILASPNIETQNRLQVLKQIEEQTNGTPLEKVKWGVICDTLFPIGGAKAVSEVFEALNVPHRRRLFTQERYPSKADGYTGAVVRTIDEVPVRVRHRNYNPNQLRVMKREIDRLLSEGKISESQSPWAAAVVLVPKPKAPPPNNIRFAIDFRLCNLKTIGFAWPLEKVDDVLGRLKGAPCSRRWT